MTSGSTGPAGAWVLLQCPAFTVALPTAAVRLALSAPGWLTLAWVCWGIR